MDKLFLLQISLSFFNNKLQVNKDSYIYLPQEQNLGLMQQFDLPIKISTKITAYCVNQVMTIEALLLTIKSSVESDNQVIKHG